MNQLIVDTAGDRRVTEDVVRAVDAPEWTDTWHPVPHRDIINAANLSMDKWGIGIKERAYSLNKSGSRMFGVWDLDAGTDTTGFALGLRHATDKSMSVGFCAGSNVFVCSNLCFSGEFVLFRKHTSGFDLDQLQILSDRAIESVVPRMEVFLEWQNSLHKKYVEKSALKCFVFDLVMEGVIPGSQITNYLSAVDEEKQIRKWTRLDGCNSLYNLHGGATRLMRNWSLLRASEASIKLNKVCDTYMMEEAA